MLLSNDFTNRLSISINSAKKRLVLSSAFIKLEALKLLSEKKLPEVDVFVISRWKKQDLLVGASDLEVYDYCRDREWGFGIDQNFHGKLYLIDDTEIYLGSANLTSNGLGFNSSSNFEFGTTFFAADADMEKINNFLNEEVTWLNDQMYEAICADINVSKTTSEPFVSTSWSDEVKALINTPVNYLWVNDLPFVAPIDLMRLDLNCEFAMHDFEMLGLDVDRLSKKDLVLQFKRSRVYSWLLNQLAGAAELRFGALTKLLHDALLDDPAPYRRDVKDLLSNIFEWVKFMPDEFVATKHNVTTSIKLTGPK
jgi:hypothetical protein